MKKQAYSIAWGILILLLSLVVLNEEVEANQPPVYTLQQELHAETLSGEMRSDGDDRAKAHYLSGIALLAEPGKTMEAIKEFELAVSLERQNAEYHYKLAEAYKLEFPSAGMLRKPFIALEVKEHLEEAVQYDANSVPYREALLEYYLLAPSLLGGGFDKAHVQAQQIYRLDSYMGLLAIGKVMAEKGNFKLSEDCFRKAIKVKPGAGEAYRRLGEFLFSKKRIDDAIAVLEKCLMLTPDDSEGYRLLGDAYVAKGKVDVAVAHYGRALKADPSTASHLFRKAQMYEFRGSFTEAVQYYQIYLVLIADGPDKVNAQKRVSELMN
ncbi:MAG: tetratricopeptide repeat protein [bacterium]